MWAWMKDRHDFFKSRGGSWYDNQDQIAEATGTGVATVKRWLNKLEKHGYLERKRRGPSNSYVLKADLRVVTDSPRPSLKLSVVPSHILAPALVIPAPVLVTPVSNDDDDDDYDDPFARP
jgi:DNA-binding Lrp family transcriptional regulator